MHFASSAITFYTMLISTISVTRCNQCYISRNSVQIQLVLINVYNTGFVYLEMHIILKAQKLLTCQKFARNVHLTF